MHLTHCRPLVPASTVRDLRLGERGARLGRGRRVGPASYADRGQDLILAAEGLINPPPWQGEKDERRGSSEWASSEGARKENQPAKGNNQIALPNLRTSSSGRRYGVGPGFECVIYLWW